MSEWISIVLSAVPHFPLKYLLWVFALGPISVVVYRAVRWDQLAESRQLQTRRLAIGLCIFFSLAHLGLVILNLHKPREWDFEPYWVIGQAVAEGTNPYDHDNLMRIAAPLEPSEELVAELHCFYPPISLLMFAPIGYFSFPVALVLWELVQTAALIGSLWLLVKLFAPDRSPIYPLMIVTVALGFFPTAETYFYAQTNFLILLALLLFYRDREKAIGGLWLALGICVKPVVLAVPLYVLLRGRWQSLAMMAVGLAAVAILTATLLGHNVFVQFIQRSAIPDSYVAAQFLNQSVSGTLLRLTGHGETASLQMQSPLILGAIAFLILATSVAILRLRHEADPYAFAATLAMMLMIYPATLTHYAVALLPAMALLLARAVTPGKGLPRSTIHVILLAMLFCAGKYSFGGMLLIWLTSIVIGSRIAKAGFVSDAAFDSNSLMPGTAGIFTTRRPVVADLRRIGARLVVVCACALLLATEPARGEVPLQIESIQGLPATVVQLDDGVTQLRGPQSLYLKSSALVPSQGSVLEFEYFCIGGIAAPTATAGPGDDSKLEQAVVRQLEPLEHRETWSRYVARLNPPGQPPAIDWSQFRLELPLKSDQVLQIRSLRLRGERLGEFDAVAAVMDGEGARLVAADPRLLESYLSQKFPCSISRVRVGRDRILIEGSTDSAPGRLVLADIPMETVLGTEFNAHALIDVEVAPEGRFSVEVPRVTLRDGRGYDRLTSRWQLWRHDGTAWRPVSHARYSDEVHCFSPERTPVQPRTKKGLGGWTPSRLPEKDNELQALGITSVTVNVAAIHQFVSLVPREGHQPFQWQGKTYYANERELARYDETFRQAEKVGAMVSAILLISNPAKSRDPIASLLAHPDVDESGTYAMPNVTSREGLELYGAILDRMAQRWSKDDGVHGRVHHWIVHNEVDAGWVWTNAGEKEAIAYLDLYQRSMRLIHLIARQYDPHAQAFITLTHHWAKAGNPRFFGSKKMLELLVRFCAAEGDFQWGLAYHPYPQSLFKPRTWEDHQATFDFATDKITPKNLEVLDAFMKQPALRFQGHVRAVHLSENGFNSPDYSDESLRDQAAGMAYAWKKVSALSSIDVWHYHNWIDNRREGGLRIGLRKFPDDPEEPLGKKPIWFVYQAYGTPEEEAVFERYLEPIGLTHWDEVIFRDPISPLATAP